MPDDQYEIELGALHGRLVVGVDEVGRGPLAGPVTAAAVILDLKTLPATLRRDLQDSKKLTARRREALAAAIPDYAATALASATPAEIDEINILQASLLAMQRAVAALPVVPEAALIDGLHAPALPCAHRCLVGGDDLSWSVAAASILAKVARDAEMERLAAGFPGYGWERNRGYGTAEHRRALLDIGPCQHHRRSFSPIRQLSLPNT